MIILDHEDQQRQLQNIYQHHHEQHLRQSHRHWPNSSRDSHDSHRDSTPTDVSSTASSSTTTLTTHAHEYELRGLSHSNRGQHHIPDDRPPYSSADSLYLRFPEKAALPDYETSEASHHLNLTRCRSPGEVEESGQEEIDKPVLRRRSRRRSSWCSPDPKMWRAIIYALGIYVLLSVLVGVPIAVVKSRNKHVKYVSTQFPDPSNSISLSSANAWLSSDDAKCEIWLTPDEDPKDCAFKTSYQLDFTGSYYIRSNITSTTAEVNPHSVGNLTVVTNPDKSARKSIFSVEVVASNRELLHQVSACFDNVGSDKGLFVFALRPLEGSDFVNVKVQVLLPYVMGAKLDNFVTYLPWFSHNFGDLEDYVTFNNVVLEGSGYNVVAKSLQAASISIKNNYGSIIGKYHVTNSLSLDGIKGDISTDVVLERDPLVINPTYLSMDTGDGAINSTLTLVSPSSVPAIPSTPYSFVANVQTFNGPLDLSVRAPCASKNHGPSPIQLLVQNSDGMTNVVLDSTIQGSFTTQSKLDNVTIKMLNPPTSADPQGKNRTWGVQKDQALGNRVLGWVGWGKRPSPTTQVESQIRVLSSLSSITLQLGKRFKENFD